MDTIKPPGLEPVGGIVMLVLVFLLREISSGALKSIGEDAWQWVKDCRLTGHHDPVDVGIGNPKLKVVKLRSRRTHHPEDEAV